MKLSEKFKQWLDTKPRGQIREVQLELISDDYAIEFAHWLEWCDYKAFNTYEELLEIFKKEKGL